MTQAALQSPRHLMSDRFAIRSAMTAIRNAFTPTRERQPLAIADLEADVLEERQRARVSEVDVLQAQQSTAARRW